MTIAYDRRVVDYISQLSATGHVTHGNFTKTSVTFHHNGGRNSFADILTIWRTRQASAHFDVDATGNVAQYVDVHDYAWAVGDTHGNSSSISIEMCNETLAPKWGVSDATLSGATRLAGWLFAHVIKAEPTKDNFFPHQHWSSTDCPGPYVMGKWAEILADVQRAYHSFVGTTVNNPPSNNHETNAQVAQEVYAGKWGNNPGRAAALTKAGYNATTIQNLVNQLAKNGGSTPKPVGKSISELADEVIDGKWGDGPERVEKLKAAGYDPVAVQHEVNSKLK